jgi:uncharacterized protein YdaU (DUF1376 family)
MHYYQFNIADYQTHTRHLSLIQDICYRRMLDWVYLHEKPLPSEPKEVARILLLNECLTDVEQVLNEYFTLVEHGWVNVRALSEIQVYNDKLHKASLAGKASGVARKNNIKQSVNKDKQTLNERSTDVEPNKNHKPLTTNHNKNTKSERADALDDGFDEFWNYYPKKVGKDKAKTEWNKKKPHIDDVLKALKWQKDSEQWDKGFIPNPATYISQGRWKDEPILKGVPF